MRKQLQEADKTQLEFKLFCRRVRRLMQALQKCPPLFLK